MCDGRRFQADGAATEKELLESWRLNRCTIKSPRRLVAWLPKQASVVYRTYSTYVLTVTEWQGFSVAKVLA